MCGLCGIVGEVNSSLATSMLKSISYRGPDHFSVFEKKNSSFGGCRLCIIGDTATPLPTEDTNESVGILLNGEIYNYIPLRSELEESGVTFNKGCESEVVLELLKKGGPDAAKRLEGMFAFAYLDDEQLVLARDRFGIKPLFYLERGSKIIFASEVKAILKYPGFAPIIDEEALKEIVVFGYIISEDRTLFKGIKQVPPGVAMVFTPHNRKEVRYHKMPHAYCFNGENRDYDSDVSMLREIFSQSMANLMSHDNQRKGIYLSGGLDSSFLTLLAAKYSNTNIISFTLADSKDSEDFIAARKVAETIGSEHHEYIVNIRDYLGELPEFIHHYESIMAGGVFDTHGGIAFQLLSRRVAEHVKVAFSGEGADELFGGYYWAYTHPLGFADRIRARLSRLQDQREIEDAVHRLFPEPENETLYRINIFDFLVRGGLTNYHLWSVDRSTSAFSFEVRPAYLYDKVAEFALNLPIEYKSFNGETKIILRDVARPLFEEIGIGEALTRQKQGMPAAVRNVATEVERIAEELVPPSSLNNHPFSKYLTNSLEAMMFDIFFYIFVENHGEKIDSFEVIEFFKEGLNARMYD